MSTAANCEHCGSTPAFPVVWTEPDGIESTVYLCADCDQREMDEIDREHHRLKVLSAQSNTSMGNLVRRALYAAGVIGENKSATEQ